MIYFTSDTHFFHDNIIGYCDRPFLNTQMMNEVLIERWNRVVKPEDTIYHLGDFSMGVKENIPVILERLNGYKILIRGNHDRSAEYMKQSGFNEVHEKMFLNTEYGMMFLAHIPTPNGHWAETAKYHLCGHVHDLWIKKESMINVGTDVWDFTPRTISELVEENNV